MLHHICIRKRDSIAMMALKVFVALAAVLAKAQADELHPDLQELSDQLHDKCVSESGVAEELIATARKGTFPEDHTFKCYIKCLYDTPKLLHADGTIDVEAAVAQVPDSLKHLYEEAITKCGTQVGTDVCDTCFKTAKCIFENTKDHFYLI